MAKKTTPEQELSNEEIAATGIYTPETALWRVSVTHARVTKNAVVANVEIYALDPRTGQRCQMPLAFEDDLNLGKKGRREELFARAVKAVPGDDPPRPWELEGLLEHACARVRYVMFAASGSVGEYTGGFMEEFNLGDLRREVEESGEGIEIEYLITLNREDILRKGASTLASGGPKAGKTEWLIRCVMQWTDEKVLYFSEEPKLIWRQRIAQWPVDAFDHVTIVLAPKWGQQKVMGRIKKEDQTVVIIDSVAGVFVLNDENDNAEVANELMPFCGYCASKGQTLIAAHHTRKGKGAHGERSRGASAFLGAVDVWLEFDYVEGSETRRLIKGQGRIINPPAVLYELLPDGSMEFVGTPGDAVLEVVKSAVLGVLKHPEWMTTPEVASAVQVNNAVSYDQIHNALKELASPPGDGTEVIEIPTVERDPPMGDKKQHRGKAHKWRKISSDDSSDEYEETAPKALPGGIDDSSDGVAEGE